MLIELFALLYLRNVFKLRFLSKRLYAGGNDIVKRILFNITLGLHGKACYAVARYLRQQRAAHSLRRKGERRMLYRGKMPQRYKLFNKALAFALHGVLERKNVAVAVTKPARQSYCRFGFWRMAKQQRLHISLRHWFILRFAVYSSISFISSVSLSSRPLRYKYPISVSSPVAVR